MKRTIAILMILLTGVFFCTACSKKDVTFTAVVQENWGEILLVTIDKDAEDEIGATGQVLIPMTEETVLLDSQGNAIEKDKFEAQDHVEIICNGVVMESYPPLIETVSQVKKLD